MLHQNGVRADGLAIGPKVARFFKQELFAAIHKPILALSANVPNLPELQHVLADFGRMLGVCHSIAAALISVAALQIVTFGIWRPCFPWLRPEKYQKPVNGMT
jgi:hypothetical protein